MRPASPGARFAKRSDALVEHGLAYPFRVLDGDDQPINRDHPEPAGRTHDDDFIPNLNHDASRSLHSSRSRQAGQSLSVVGMIGVW